MFLGLSTFEKHGQETICFLVCPPSGNMPIGNNVSWFVHLQETWLGNNFFLICPPSGNMARKQCFLVCPPSGNMAKEQCFLVCPPSGNMAIYRKRYFLVCPPSGNMARCFLVCPPSRNMARKQYVSWVAHLQETCL